MFFAALASLITVLTGLMSISQNLNEVHAAPKKNAVDIVENSENIETLEGKFDVLLARCDSAKKISEGNIRFEAHNSRRMDKHLNGHNQ